ncbi:MAG TPA: hypothetical protein VGD33_00650 [Chitinophagaceae bacterium]
MPLELMTKRGVLQHYGQRKTNQKYGGEVSANFKRSAIWVFNYNDLPTYGTSKMELIIPANSTILSAKLRILAAFTSTSTTTDLDIGLFDSAGNEIDADGLITAAQATQTTIAVVGSIIDGASGTPGALINKTIGATNGELVVTPNVADLLTGRGEIIVEYLLPFPSQQA